MSYNEREKAIRRRICDFVVANYEKLDDKDLVMGELPWNFKCHLNSVQKVLEKKAEGVWSCVAIDLQGNPIVHFINRLKGREVSG